MGHILPTVCAQPGCREHATPGQPRCPKHTRHNWNKRPRAGPSPWASATYRRNRWALLAGGADCHWCGRRATSADHLVPVAEGGTHELENLVPSCLDCNRKRGAALGARRANGRRGGQP